MKKLVLLILFLQFTNTIFAQEPMYSAAEKSRENMQKSNESLNAVYEANLPNASSRINKTGFSEAEAEQINNEWNRIWGKPKTSAENEQYYSDTKIYDASSLQSKAILIDVESKVMDYSQFISDLQQNITDLTPSITNKILKQTFVENQNISINATLRNGALEGLCTIEFKKNEKISSINCIFINGKINGLATVIFANGNAENINFVNNNLYGKCQLQAANNTVLMSCYRNNNKVNGLVKRFYDGGSYADVLYKENKPVTLLKSYLSDRNYYYPCNEMYSRSYHVYVKDNNIVKRFDDESGSFWSGKRKGDIYNGAGMRGFSNGTLFIGEFKNGSLRGVGSYIYADGSIYNGEFNGAADGLGKTLGSNGDVYEGNYKDNYFHGAGKLTYADGSVFKGKFKEGERNGEGRFTKKNGKYIQGRFQIDNNKLKYFDALNNEISKEQYDAD